MTKRRLRASVARPPSSRPSHSGGYHNSIGVYGFGVRIDRPAVMFCHNQPNTHFRPTFLDHQNLGTIKMKLPEWIVETAPLSLHIVQQFRNWLHRKPRPTLNFTRPPLDYCSLMEGFNHVLEYERASENSKQSIASSIFYPSQRLFSVEKKHSFVAGHHVKTLLFCPEQASQVELEFTAETHRQFIIFVRAPNGERSPLMHFHGFGNKQNFNPGEVNFLLLATSSRLTDRSNFTACEIYGAVGCGHGIWHVDILLRVGARFVVANSFSLDLRGCGILMYGIDHNLRLVLRSQLWLSVMM